MLLDSMKTYQKIYLLISIALTLASFLMVFVTPIVAKVGGTIYQYPHFWEIYFTYDKSVGAIPSFIGFFLLLIGGVGLSIMPFIFKKQRILVVSIASVIEIVGIILVMLVKDFYCRFNSIPDKTLFSLYLGPILGTIFAILNLSCRPIILISEAKEKNESKE